MAGQQAAGRAGPDAGRLAALTGRERDAYAAAHPRSRQAFADSGASLLGGVPMTWMAEWAGGFPLHLYLLNRGILITPFHNMALMCPDTAADVDAHTEVCAAAAAELAA